MSTEIRKWPGLMTNASAHDIPPGAAVVQDNWMSLIPGKLTVRGGLQAHAFTPILTDLSNDVLGLYTWQTVRGNYVAIHDDQGNVFLGGYGAVNQVNWTLETNVPTAQPSCWCEDRRGKLIRVDGLERGTIYNEEDLWELGITAPGTAPTVGTTADGGDATAGDYVCAIRYLDEEGIPSNITAFTEVAADDNDQFDWTWLEAAEEDRVTTVELYRSTADQQTTLYLVLSQDIDGTKSHTDVISDDTLAENTALPVTWPDGSLASRRFVPPPENMAVVEPFQDRYFYTVPTVMLLAAYSQLTGWEENIVGRYLYREDKLPVEITDSTATNITIDGSSTSVVGLISADASTMVGPPPAERNMIYYSEVDEPESVPTSQNTIIVQENTWDNDWLTGLHAHGAVCWVFKERHTYRMTFVRQPIIDVGLNLFCSRGSVNQNTVAYFEDIAYVMDQMGCWSLTPGGYEPISDPVQNYFRDGTISWTNKIWFFVSVEPNEAVVRFHVQFTGDTGTRPKRALCYSIRRRTWWQESYQEELSTAAHLPLAGVLRTIVGGETGNVLLQSEGVADEGDVAIAATYRSGSFPIPEKDPQRPDRAPDDGKRAIIVTYDPTAASHTLSMQKWFDHGTAGQDSFTDGPLAGATVTPGSPTIGVELKRQRQRPGYGEAPGYFRIPFVVQPRHGLLSHRFVSVQMAVSQATEQVTIHALGLEDI